jgi:hypothetical protein
VLGRQAQGPLALALLLLLLLTWRTLLPGAAGVGAGIRLPGRHLLLEQQQGALLLPA